MEDKILEIIKEESEKANVRKYTCINGFGYSQFERNITERVVKLFCQPVAGGMCEHPWDSVIGDGEMKPAKCLKCGKYL